MWNKREQRETDSGNNDFDGENSYRSLSLSYGVIPSTNGSYTSDSTSEFFNRLVQNTPWYRKKNRVLYVLLAFAFVGSLIMVTLSILIFVDFNNSLNS